MGILINKPLFLIALLGLSCLSCKKEVIEDPVVPIRGTRITKIIAHRGYWATEGSFENSITAITKAIQLGADGVEFDIRRTKDDSVIVNHDPKYSGYQIATTDYLTLSSIRLPNGDKLPTLREVLRIVQDSPDLILFIELKTFDVAEPLIRVLKEEKPSNPVIFISFSKEACLRMIEEDPSFRVELLKDSGDPENASDLKSAGFYGLAYSLGFYNKHNSLINEALTNGLSLSSWVVDSKKDYSRLFDQGFTYVISDKPGALIAESLSNQRYWRQVYY